MMSHGTATAIRKDGVVVRQARQAGQDEEKVGRMEEYSELVSFFYSGRR